MPFSMEGGNGTERQQTRMRMKSTYTVDGNFDLDDNDFDGDGANESQDFVEPIELQGTAAGGDADHTLQKLAGMDFDVPIAEETSSYSVPSSSSSSSSSSATTSNRRTRDEDRDAALAQTMRMMEEDLVRAKVGSAVRRLINGVRASRRVTSMKAFQTWKTGKCGGLRGGVTRASKGV